jgi:hypothetical protein
MTEQYRGVVTDAVQAVWKPCSHAQLSTQLPGSHCLPLVHAAPCLPAAIMLCL